MGKFENNVGLNKEKTYVIFKEFFVYFATSNILGWKQVY